MGHAQANAINRVLQARGLGTLDDPGIVERLAGIVENHSHFTELLRACEPRLRREMYEAMRPHLKFPAKPLEDYIIAAKEHAVAAEYPTLEADGNLKGYSKPVVQTTPSDSDRKALDKTAVLSEVPLTEVWIQCSRCGAENLFYGERRVDAVKEARNAGWGWDEFELKHLCPTCLDQIGDSDCPGPVSK